MAFANPKPIVLKFSTTKANYDILNDSSAINQRIKNNIYNFNEVGMNASIRLVLDSGSTQVKFGLNDGWNDFIANEISIDRPRSIKNIIIKDQNINGTILIDMY
ncbi:MAG: hypothetical protein ACRCX8_03470 [Sarcina sp.]